MKTLIKTIIISTLIFTLSTLNAKTTNYSTGLGLQFGGIIGYQISTTSGQHNFRAAVGLIGASIGYDYFISDTFSLGLTATATSRNAKSINLNYYASGYNNEGWVVGLDITHLEGNEQSGSGFFSRRAREEKNEIWLSVGYRF